MKGLTIFRRHLGYSVDCLGKYKVGKPFHYTIQSYFKENPRFGSKDRRRIKAICYAWFRLGYALPNIGLESKALWAHLILNQERGDWVEQLLVEMNLPGDWFENEPYDRLRSRQDQLSFDWSKLFPLTDLISTELDQEAFLKSQIEQPLLWFRTIRGGISEEGFKPLEETVENAQAVEMGTQMDRLKGGKNVVVQDFSSQRIMHKVLEKGGFNSVWDCCSASGGKSLYLLDQKPTLEVYASDVRKSILHNLKARFRHHRHWVSTGLLDLSKSYKSLRFSNGQGEQVVEIESFDAVIADVPCTGSGTWSRNPEFKQGFDSIKAVEKYVNVQKKVLQNAWPFLKPGGLLVYSTCSVYRKENEEVVSGFCKEHACILEEQGYVPGYHHRSDTMFYAFMRKK